MDDRSNVVQLKTPKFLEDNIGETLDDLGFGDVISDTIPKSCSMNEFTTKGSFLEK